MNHPLLDLRQTLFLGRLFQPIHCREWKPELTQRWFKLILYISSYSMFLHNMKREQHPVPLVFQKHMKYTKINSFSIKWQWSNRKWNKNIIYNDIPNHQICRNNLIKAIQDLDTENYKILPREVKEDLSKWKYIPFSWIGSLNIVKMTPCSNRFTDSMQSYFKSRQAFPLWQVTR